MNESENTPQVKSSEELPFGALGYKQTAFSFDAVFVMEVFGVFIAILFLFVFLRRLKQWRQEARSRRNSQKSPETSAFQDQEFVKLLESLTQTHPSGLSLPISVVSQIYFGLGQSLENLGYRDASAHSSSEWSQKYQEVPRGIIDLAGKLELALFKGDPVAADQVMDLVQIFLDWKKSRFDQSQEGKP